MSTRIVVICIAVAVLLGFLLWPRSPERTPPEQAEVPAFEEQEQAEPPRYPVPERTESVESRPQSDDEGDQAPELPPLDESDPAVVEALTENLGENLVERWLVADRVVERAVVLVNSLDGSAIPLRLRPLRPTDEEPIVDESGDEQLAWSPANADRYTPQVDALLSIEPDRAAELYQRHYPLFQEAWSALGENEPYFNDRLVEVLDRLIDTPEVELPVPVEPYEGHYRFADETLEEQSWGQKALIRTGPDNARRIREWLREFREAVTATEDS
ncbi:DUF3014 domain-containing protein [Wenzhouxiangella sp. XN201]|uniref:DUF3014 domain-containing protein n=1 Tax=Wenzhouxiangella sp. XN201 TaxID=2710755 RepID=UPI0013C92EB4|nr:DUF3014 domain-containing protein [Wenzhouxiangella sp. XN201]